MQIQFTLSTLYHLEMKKKTCDGMERAWKQSLRKARLQHLIPMSEQHAGVIIAFGFVIVRVKVLEMIFHHPPTVSLVSAAECKWRQADSSGRVHCTLE